MIRCLTWSLSAALLPALLAFSVADVALAQQQPAGVVTGVQGQAQLTRPAVAPASLKFKDGVVIRDIVDTREKSLARILFGGRSTVTVRELSRLEVREELLPTGARRDVHDLSSGAILVHVARQLMKPGDEVQIRTPNAVAAVRGSTVFAVFNAVLNQSFFAFLSGTGIITPQGLPTVTLTANTQNNGANVSGTGANVQVNIVNVPVGQVNQILAESQVGKAVKEEASKEQTLQGAVKEAAELAKVVVEQIAQDGGQQAGGAGGGTEGTGTGDTGGTKGCTTNCGTQGSGGDSNGGGGGTGTIGSYSAINSGGREQYGLNSNSGSGSSSYIQAAKDDLVTFGHTLGTPTNTITSSYLNAVKSFYLGLLGSTPSSSERSALSEWVSGGGRLFIQQDHTGGSWFAPANTILGDFGFGATDSSTSNSHFIVGSHAIATNPNNLSGLTFTGSANSKFDASDIPSDATIFARGGSTSGPITGAVRPFGSGKVATTTDIDMWSSFGGYGAGTNMQRLWENIWSYLNGNSTEDPPLFTVANGEKFVGPSFAPQVQVANLSVMFDSVLLAEGPTASVSLSGPLLRAQNAKVTAPFNLLGMHNGSRLVSTSNDPLVWLQGGDYSLSTRTGNSIFRLWGTESAVDSETGVEVGTTQSVTHSGVLLQASDGATIDTEKVLKLDTALLEATAPIISLLGTPDKQTGLTTQQSTIDLVKAKVTSNGPVVAMDKSFINVTNGALINLTHGSNMKVTGDLISMYSGSKINVVNGPLISVAGAGSLLDVSGALVNFGGTGGNKIIVNNSIAPTATLSGLPVSATWGGSVNIGGTAVKNPGLGSISVNGSLISATNSGTVNVQGK
jgi:hypothetical protein